MSFFHIKNIKGMKNKGFLYMAMTDQHRSDSVFLGI